MLTINVTSKRQLLYNEASEGSFQLTDSAIRKLFLYSKYRNSLPNTKVLLLDVRYAGHNCKFARLGSVYIVIKSFKAYKESRPIGVPEASVSQTSPKCQIHMMCYPYMSVVRTADLLGSGIHERLKTDLSNTACDSHYAAYQSLLC